MLGALLEAFGGMIADEDITIVVATGAHRGNTGEELQAMLGEDVLRRARVLNHDARDPGALQWMGRMGDDVPVWLNRAWCDADVRITTGFVEPHFFASFSGRPKLVAPGLAALDTILCLHDARRIGHAEARWGVTAGDLAAEHSRAVSAARDLAMVGVAEPFDVVVTTNAGYPLDQNLYQVVKGMSAAAQIVKSGGAIVVAAQARIQQHAQVSLFTTGLSPREIAEAHLRPARSVEEAVTEALRRRGPHATLAVLPDGPQTIPFVQQRGRVLA